MANTLITLKNASLAFGDYPLLDNTDFSVQEGERIGLIGRNGTGKSSMLQVLARKSALDDGEIQVKDGLQLCFWNRNRSSRRLPRSVRA